MKKIPLTQGKFAIVDDKDYERLSKHKWHLRRDKNTCYAARHASSKGGKSRKKMIWMHREILGISDCDNLLTDHRNRNGLDNRQENIRPCTHSQNALNYNYKTKGSSKYRGVCHRTKGKEWEANIKINGKGFYLGTYNNEKQAAKAYDRAAEAFHGEFACLNFPEEQKCVS